MMKKNVNEASVKSVVMSHPDREGFWWYRNSDQHRWSVIEVVGKVGVSWELRIGLERNFSENYEGDWIFIPTPAT